MCFTTASKGRKDEKNMRTETDNIKEKRTKRRHKGKTKQRQRKRRVEHRLPLNGN